MLCMTILAERIVASQQSIQIGSKNVNTWNKKRWLWYDDVLVLVTLDPLINCKLGLLILSYFTKPFTQEFEMKTGTPFKKRAKICDFFNFSLEICPKLVTFVSIVQNIQHTFFWSTSYMGKWMSSYMPPIVFVFIPLLKRSE